MSGVWACWLCVVEQCALGDDEPNIIVVQSSHIIAYPLHFVNRTSIGHVRHLPQQQQRQQPRISVLLSSRVDKCCPPRLTIQPAKQQSTIHSMARHDEFFLLFWVALLQWYAEGWLLLRWIIFCCWCLLCIRHWSTNDLASLRALDSFLSWDLNQLIKFSCCCQPPATGSSYSTSWIEASY